MYNTNNNNKNYVNNYRSGNSNGSANTVVSLPSSLTFANRSAAMITPSKVKQKLTLSSVTGKIIVYSAEDGSTRIGQWGGTECFLSIQPNLGPCLVVRSSRHKRHEGTFFQLHFLQQLFASHVNEGKLTIVIRHQRQLCSVFIETVNDVNELRIMAATLQDRQSWSMIERNVACKQTKNGSYAISSNSTNTNNSNSSNGGNTYASGRLRDPMLAPLQNEDYDSNDDDNDSYDERERDNKSNKEENNIMEKNTTMTAQSEETVMEDNNNTSVNTNTSNEPINSNQANLLQPSLEEREPFTLSEDMRKALHYIKNGENVFITLPASNRSKTNNNVHGMETWFASLFTLLEHKMHSHVLVTSPLASASHKCNRLNIYSLLCIRPHKSQYKLDRVLQKIKKDVDKWQLWQHCEVCMVEEVHLLPTNVFTLLCQVASSIRKTITGSKEHKVVQWIVLGDFLQLPPYSLMGNTIINKNNSANNEINKREQLEEWEENVMDDCAFLSEEWEQCKFTHIHLECDISNKSTLSQCAEDVRKGKWSNTVEQTWRTVWNSSKNTKEEDNEANTIASIKEENINTLNAVESKAGKFEIEPVEMFISREEANKYNLQHLSSIHAASSDNNNLSRLYHYESDDYASIPGTNIDENVVLLPHLSLKVGAQVILLSNDSFAIAPQSSVRDNNNMITDATTTYCQLEQGEVGLIFDFTSIANNKFTTPHNVNNYNINNKKNGDEEEEEEVLPIVYFSRRKVSVVVHRLLIEVRCDISSNTENKYDGDVDNRTIINGAWNNKHLFMSRRQLPLSLCWALSLYDAHEMTLPKVNIQLSLVNDVHHTEILCVREEPMICGFLYVMLSCVLNASDIGMTFINNTGVNNFNNNTNKLLDVLRSFVSHKSASHMALKYYARHFPRRYECVPSIEHIHLMEENIVKNERKGKRARRLNSKNEDEDYKLRKQNDSNNTVQEEYALHEIAVNMPISNTIPSLTQDSQLYELNNTQSTLIKGLLLDDEEDTNT